MYCPNCGKNQTGADGAFCRSCGLQLGEAKRLLSVSGAGPPRGLSPRTKGILQGAAIVPTSLGLWLILDIFYEGVFGAGMLGGLYAMVTLIFLAATARIVYAFAMEEGSKGWSPTATQQGAGEQLDTNELPRNVSGPAELTMPADPIDVPVHSVVDNTTRKLTQRGW